MRLSFDCHRDPDTESIATQTPYREGKELMSKDSKEQSEKAVAVRDGSNYLVTTDIKDFNEILEANLAGEKLTPKMLDRIKVPAGGSTTWMVPTIEGEKPMQTIQGVIVHMQTIRTYWAEDFSGQGGPPDCGSRDGINGFGTPGGQCLSCPLNEFGSGKGGRSKACNEKIMVFFMTEDSFLPTLLLVPPGSLTSFRQEYMPGLLKRLVKKHHVVTEFSLVPDKNDSSIVFSKVKCRMVGKVANPDVWDEIADTMAKLVSNVEAEELQAAASDNGTEQKAA